MLLFKMFIALSADLSNDVDFSVPLVALVQYHLELLTFPISIKRWCFSKEFYCAEERYILVGIAAEPQL